MKQGTEVDVSGSFEVDYVSMSCSLLLAVSGMVDNPIFHIEHLIFQKNCHFYITGESILD